MSTHFTPWRSRTARIRSGPNSDSATGHRPSAGEGESERLLMAPHPRVDAETEVGRGDGPIGLIDVDETRHQLDPARAGQGDDLRERRLGPAALEPSDGGLGGAETIRQLGLTQAGPAPRLPNDLTALHAGTIAVSLWLPVTPDASTRCISRIKSCSQAGPDTGHVKAEVGVQVGGGAVSMDERPRHADRDESARHVYQRFRQHRSGASFIE